MNPLDRQTEQALMLFNQREEERKSNHTLSRVLLKIENGHLVAVEEPADFWNRWLSFDYSKFKLQTVVTYLMSRDFSACSDKKRMWRALHLLDKKIEKHNNFFNWIFGRMIELHQRMTDLLAKVLKFPQPGSLTNIQLGGGITNNNATACYVNSVLQALRVCPSFRKALKDRVVNDELQKQLTAIYQKIEAGHTISSEEITAFRACSSNGWRPGGDPLTRQQDAGEFFLHLFEKLGMKGFSYDTTVHYEQPIKVPSLERQGGQNISVLQLAISEAKAGASVADLCLENRCLEAVEKAAIVGTEGFLPTPEEFDKIAALPDSQVIPTLQATVFAEDKGLPQFLPIRLTRYDKTGKKIDKEISPSEEIQFPIKGQSNKLAKYRIASVVLHRGSDIHGGHYYTYARSQTGGWVEYNDARVAHYHEFDPSPVEDIATRGYLYFYEFAGFVNAAGSPIGVTSSS